MTNLTDRRCICGDGWYAHGNPSHACDAGGWVEDKPVVVLAEGDADRLFIELRDYQIRRIIGSAP